MATILSKINQSFKEPNIAASYGPYSASGNKTALKVAHDTLSADRLNIIGMTVGIVVDENTIEEYWYQGGTNLVNLVKKQSSDVEANPTGDATTPLNKLKIGETIYNIPQVDTSNLATKDELQQGLSGKQDTINDISTIRSGAAAGATAVQPDALDNYVPKSQTTGLLKSDGTVDTETAGRAESALQPKQSGQYTQGDIVIFNANGGLADSQKKTTDFAPIAQAVPTPQSGDEGKILGYETHGGVQWVTRPQDGANGESAYQLYVDGGGTLTQSEWLASLKANIGEFLFVPTDAAAVSAMSTIGQTYPSAIDPNGKNVAPTQNTLSVILLMNAGTTLDKTMMIATQETATAGVYEFVYAGDLQSAMPSNVLTEADKDDTHLDNPASRSLAKAEDIMTIKSALENAYSILEEKAEVMEYKVDSVSGYYTFSQTTLVWNNGNNYIKSAKVTVDNKKYVRFLGYEGSLGLNYIFFDSSDNVVSNKRYDNSSVTTRKQYIVKVPSNAQYLICIYYYKQYPSDNIVFDNNQFYAYVSTGDKVIDTINHQPHVILLGDTGSVSITYNDGWSINVSSNRLIAKFPDSRLINVPAFSENLNLGTNYLLYISNEGTLLISTTIQNLYLIGAIYPITSTYILAQLNCSYNVNGRPFDYPLASIGRSGIINNEDYKLIFDSLNASFIAQPSALSFRYIDGSWHVIASAANFIALRFKSNNRVSIQTTDLTLTNNGYLVMNNSGVLRVEYYGNSIIGSDFVLGYVYPSIDMFYMLCPYNVEGRPFNIRTGNVTNVYNPEKVEFDEWQPNHAYKSGDKFIHNSTDYLAVANFTSGESWGSSTTNYAISLAYINNFLKLATFTKSSSTDISVQHFICNIPKFVKYSDINSLEIGDFVYFTDYKILAIKKTNTASYWFQKFDFVPFYKETIYLHNDDIYLFKINSLISLTDIVDNKFSELIYDYNVSYPIIPNELFIMDDYPTPLFKKSMFLNPNEVCDLVLTSNINGRHRVADVINPINIEYSKIGETCRITLEKPTDFNVNVFKDIKVNKGSISSKSGSSINLLMIGDSITHGNNGNETSPVYMANILLPQRYSINVNTIGTFAPYTLPNSNRACGEGRGSWSWEALVGIDNNPYGSLHFPSIGAYLEQGLISIPQQNTTTWPADLPNLGKTDPRYNPFTFPATESDKQNYPEYCFTNSNNYPNEPDGFCYSDASTSEELSYHYFIFDMERYLALFPNIIPDIITVALGTNDWGPSTQIDLEKTLKSIDIFYNRVRSIESLENVSIGLVSANNIATVFQNNSSGNWVNEIAPLLLNIQKKIKDWNDNGDNNIHEIPLYACGCRWLAFDGNTAQTSTDLSENNCVQKQTIDTNVHLLDGAGSDGYWEYMDALMTCICVLTPDNI